MRHFTLVLLVAGLTMPSCKDGRVVAEKDGSDADASAIVLPRRVQNQQPVVTSEFEVDEKSGRPKPFLILRLDYFPKPEPGSTSLPACFREFPADFVLGTAKCVDGGGEVGVFAKNVEQDCYTDPGGTRASASDHLILPGCKRAELHAYAFDPQIRIDAEVR